MSDSLGWFKWITHFFWLIHCLRAIGWENGFIFKTFFNFLMEKSYTELYLLSWQHQPELSVGRVETWSCQWAHWICPLPDEKRHLQEPGKEHTDVRLHTDCNANINNTWTHISTSWLCYRQVWHIQNSKKQNLLTWNSELVSCNSELKETTTVRYKLRITRYKLRIAS